MSKSTPTDAPSGTPSKAAAKPRKTATRKRKPASVEPSASRDESPAIGNAAPDGSPSAPPAPTELIRVPLSVRWRDLDAFNHVNNSKFLSYLEEARLRWMLSVPGQGLEDHVAPVVAAANLNYRRPIEWPSEIAIELYVERLGNTSVSIGHRIVDADRADVLYCDGSVVLVWIDRGTGKAAPLPPAVRESCSPS